MESYGTIWVCGDCMTHHVNGECGGCHGDHGHDKEPLGLLVDFHPAMGMSHEEHSEDCSVNIAGSWMNSADECDCETNTFSRSQCEGCGTYLHGERHAMTLFKD